MQDVSTRRRWLLPHWEKSGGTYFVTFRLADSFPAAARTEIETDRQRLIATRKSRRLSPQERTDLENIFSDKIQSILDASAGSCTLARPEIAEIVAGSLRAFDESRYRLYAWCVMPNHVHVIFEPRTTHHLSDIVHSWKSYSAKMANRILGRTGTFWQREYWDRLIRNDEEFSLAVAYVIGNPEKAGLRGWKWMGLANLD